MFFLCVFLSVCRHTAHALSWSLSVFACLCVRETESPAQPNPAQGPSPPLPQATGEGGGRAGGVGGEGGGRWLLPANTEHPTVAGWLIHWLASCLLSGLSACGLHHSQQVQPQCFAKLMGKRHVYKPKCFPWQESLSHARQQIRTTQVKPQ